jgi:hypothetical protein
MKAAGFVETLVMICQVTRRHIPEGSNIHGNQPSGYVSRWRISWPDVQLRALHYSVAYLNAGNV